MYIRLQQNPTYYKLEGSRSGQSIQEQVDDICFRDINLLRDYSLTTGDEQFRCTEFGHAMARYYVHFETMKVFMGIQHKSTLSEIVGPTTTLDGTKANPWPCVAFSGSPSC
jgi:ATP-dependent DNA helicase HFM1/MER3